MAEKNLIDRGTSRRPAPAASAVSVASLHDAASEPWWLPGVVGGSTSGEPCLGRLRQEAVAAAPRDVVVADRAYPGLSGFGAIVAPFVEAAAERLRDALADGEPEGDGAPVLADFRRQLTRRLARIAARTLVTELHEARRLGRLSGEGPEERFRDFVALTARRDGLDRLVTGYPCAGPPPRDGLPQHRVRLRGAGRAARRRPASAGPGRGVRRAGRRSGRARPVRGAGGAHRGRGRCGRQPPRRPVGDAPAVRRRHPAGLQAAPARGAPALQLPRRMVRFTAGRPRPAGAARPGPGDYGWAEFVAERPCASGAETRQFYRRQGALLALLHALDGTDLHHENLIACGPHPVLVDVETLFHPALGPARSADPAARALHDSVHRVGLLPQLLVGDTTALDMSAIGGAGPPRPPSRPPTGRRPAPTACGWYGERGGSPSPPTGPGSAPRRPTPPRTPTPSATDSAPDTPRSTTTATNSSPRTGRCAGSPGTRCASSPAHLDVHDAARRVDPPRPDAGRRRTAPGAVPAAHPAPGRARAVRRGGRGDRRAVVR